MSAILDAIPSAQVIRPDSGVAMICDQAMAASPLAEGEPPPGGEPEIYAAVAAAILRRSELDVVLHASGEAAPGAAIMRAAALLPAAGGRLRVVAATPLEPLLPGVDLLISFASPGLIAGCRNGLKPVQIGRAVAGSAAFSYIFADIGGFAAALAAGELAGLSLREYGEFDRFCRDVTGRGRIGRSAGLRRRGDPIAQACRPSRASWRLAMRLIGGVAGNPYAAWCLVRAGLGATSAR